MRRRAAGLVRGVWLPVLAAGLLAGCGGYGAQATAGLPAATQAQATGVAAASSGQLPATAAARAADEPVKITGVAQITFPLFESYLVEPFVLLEDEAGFVSRNFEFEMPPENQVVGPLRKTSDGQYHYTLHLPQQPVGTLVDANHSGTPQVMVFAVAVQANLIGDPFLDRSEFRGWSTSWSSARIDSENKDEIIGGALLVWAPDAAQEFPSGFGADGLLFTSDDPVAPVPAGYTVIDLELQPFRFYKEANPQLTLYEGDVAVKDYSAMSYTEAFDAMIKKVRVEYPFTDAKAVDWDAIYASLAPRVVAAQTNADPLGFYLAIRDLTWAIPDGHLGASGDDGGLFMAEAGSGVGLGLTQLDDGRVIASFVTARSAAARAGILRGAEIIEYAGKPVAAAAAAVIPWSSPFSTQHSRSLQQFRYLTRGALGSNVAVVWRNQGATEPQAAVLVLGDERESFNALSFYAGMERGVAPVTYRVISGADLPAGGVPFKSAQTGALMDARQTGLGYIKISDLSDDLNLTVRLFARAVQFFTDEEVPGIIFDMRQNGGGSPMGSGLAAYFTKTEVELSRSYYYSERTGKFETYGPPSTIEPDDSLYYPGRLVVLVGPACASACEDVAWVLRQLPQTSVLGQYPSSGMYGEVGRGQYLLPAGISMQIPTGMDRDMQGEIVIEGTGVVPDLKVPVDMVSVLSETDAVLAGALDALTLLPRLWRAVDASAMLLTQTFPESGESGGARILLPGAAPISISSGKLGSAWWQQLADAQASAVLRAGESQAVAVRLQDSADQVLWAYGWCAPDEATLAANWQQIAVRFNLEGLEVSAANLATEQHAVADGICRATFAALGDFPGGAHQLSIEVNFAEPIRAGQRIHAAGLRTYTHNVNAPQGSNN